MSRDALPTGVPVGICPAGTPFLFVIVTVFKNAIPPTEQKWHERSGMRSVSGTELEL